MAKRSKPPVVRNLAELSGPIPKGDLLIHCTEEQWTKLKRGIPLGKAVPKYGPRLEFIPNPDGGGMINFQCNPGEGQVCIAIAKPAPGGIVFECRCRPIETPRPPNSSSGGVFRWPPCFIFVPTKGI